MDVNDCTPEFSATSYEVIVAENTPVGSIITELIATDKDDGNNGQVCSEAHFLSEKKNKWYSFEL